MTIKLLQKLGRRKKVKLQFCRNNLDRFLDGPSFSQYEIFFQEEQINMKEYKCLSHCELCADKPYAILNGEIIEADTALELLELIKMKVK
ncbi:DUF1450 domain-containing protein [Bacillus benzoevorans]|uniref:Uncharacterized protein YuzB (UPF0349 family) n=1 Tax=Bacillus benzoevorans TaxID=1456 RepID=A0A7X0HQC4_9BACI|nr:DUF1450 domain-containing protein [Bacillus benzoevorans]MBB6444997.1 uncharacterized protein YuzB (UPF0349 family) [Bacillus benzoevorans]